MRPGPTRLNKQSLEQPTLWGRIDDLLSFWVQWFSNRQVSSVFISSLTTELPRLTRGAVGASQRMGCVRRSLAESARGLPRGGCFQGFFKRHLAEGERSDAIEAAQQAFRIPRRAVEVSEGFGLRRLVQCQD